MKIPSWNIKVSRPGELKDNFSFGSTLEDFIQLYLYLLGTLRKWETSVFQVPTVGLQRFSSVFGTNSYYSNQIAPSRTFYISYVGQWGFKLHGPEGKDETENVEIKVDEDTEEDNDEDDDDSQDSDYLVDEDNNMDDFDVDIENFEYNIDENVEFMGYTDDEGSRLSKRKLKPLRKQAYACEQIYKTYFYLGKEFPNKDEVKAYIKEHSIETIREIRMEKNDNQRVRAVCRGVIPFLLAFEDIELVEQLKTNLKILVRAVQEQLQQKHQLAVSQSKAFRAKQEAEKKLKGPLEDILSSKRIKTQVFYTLRKKS
ncbi:mutator type transposase [Tanacetum coccineum]